MIQTDLEHALRDLANVAEPLRRDERRSIWRFRAAGQELLLYHFPRSGKLNLNPAIQMFSRSQTLAKLGIETPRVAAQLTGLKVDGANGDAVIVEAVPNARQLDEVLREARLNGTPLPHHVSWSQQIAKILGQLGRNKWRFDGVTLASFLVASERLYLHDLRGVRRGEVRLHDVWALGNEAKRFATRADLLRSWITLHPEGLLPRTNPRCPRYWRSIVRQAESEGPIASPLKMDEWSGLFTHATQFAQPWSTASQLAITTDDWGTQWPKLIGDLTSGKLTPIKKDASGEVYSATVTLGGKSVDVIVKRPFRKLWYRYLTDVTRGAKAFRTYRKAWQLIARDVPCEWPLLLMEKKIAGYALDGVIIFERVPGTRLDQVDFDSLRARDRDTLFRRSGRTTRKIELGDLAHYDAKTTNWIVYGSPTGQPLPIIIDVDGVRPLTNGLVSFGVRRLLRALRQHPQFTPVDSLAVCQGYAPFARGLIRESESSE